MTSPLARLRNSLTSSLESSTEEPTLDAMRKVCLPVHQVATWFRNSDHAPAGAQEAALLDLLARHREITGLWEPATTDQGAGLTVYRRIDVKPGCLACHGSRDNRPAFVKQNDAENRAFDFRPGALRGMYAVFIPAVQKALEVAS